MRPPGSTSIPRLFVSRHAPDRRAARRRLGDCRVRPRPRFDRCGRRSRLSPCPPPPIGSRGRFRVDNGQVILELDDQQAAFQREIAAFAAETVAPRAQAIDESDQFPPRHRQGDGRARPARRHHSARVGRRRPRLRQLRPGARGAGARQRRRLGHRQRQQLARRRADGASSDPRRRSRRGCGGWRPASCSAPSRCRRSRPDRTPPTSRRWRGSTIAATCSTAARSGSPTRKRPMSAIVFAATQPGSRGRGVGAVPRAARHAGHHAAPASRFARRPRPRLHGSRPDGRACRRRRAARRAGRRVPRRDVGARRRPRRDRGAGARRRAGGARRGAGARQARTKPSASRSPTTRRFSGCSPTARPSSTRRAC